MSVGEHHRRVSRPALPAALFTLICALLLPAMAPAQIPTSGPQRAQVEIDPYTKNDPAALQRVSYAALGPFPFGNNQTTATIADLLGTEPLCWIETAHFRIGCALAPIELKGREDWSKDWIRATRAELQQLAEHLPGIKKNQKQLDPWLRAHLTALRLERLYAEVLDNLGATDASFPATPDRANDPSAFRGLGPYLGMRAKFTVLLVGKSSSLARFTRACQGAETGEPSRHHDMAAGLLLWSAAQESANGLFFNDFALHANLVYNVAHNLYTGYRGFCHDLPPWLVTGLAHWHARRVTPRFVTYEGNRGDDDQRARSAFWEWDKRVAGLLENKAFESLEDLFGRDNASTFGLEQHMQAWALVDFLMATRKAETFRFLRRLKDPFHGRLRMPTAQELATRQSDALGECLGTTAAELEQQWRIHVLGRRAR